MLIKGFLEKFRDRFCIINLLFCSTRAIYVHMEIKYRVTGKDRKALVMAIAEITGADVIYKGVPTCNYEVDYFTIDKFGTLICKALGIDCLSVDVEETTVTFPWFRERPDADRVRVYTHFIAALCQMSVAQKRISATEKAAENEKYAFRCFLLRL